MVVDVERWRKEEEERVGERDRGGGRGVGGRWWVRNRVQHGI